MTVVGAPPSIVHRRESSASVPRAEKPVPQRTHFRCAPRSDTRGHNSSVARTKEDGRSRACNREGVNNNNNDERSGGVDDGDGDDDCSHAQTDKETRMKPVLSGASVRGLRSVRGKGLTSPTGC